jgi:4-azaleucine resistance transporter AzlC
MTSSSTKTYFWRGFRNGVPFVLMAVPFAMLFGVVATEAGFNVAQIIGFSVIVIAGAAQFAAVQLMVEEAPAVIVVLTALAVNLRMAMYSASLAPHLGAAPLWKRAIIAYCNVDQSYTLSIARYESEPQMTLPEKSAFFFGAICPVFAGWYLGTAIGAVVGAQIPPEYALDFAMPITFIALIAPLLKTLPHVGAATTSVVLALLLAWVPYNFGLLIAGFAAMAVGAEIERRMGAA